MSHSRYRSSLVRLLSCVCLFMFGMTLVPAPVTTGEEAPLDLSAVLIHTTDLDWIVEEYELTGQMDDAPFITDLSLNATTVDEVLASSSYLHGRGGFLPAAAETVDLEEMLDQSEWIRTVDAYMVRQSSLEGSWITGIGASIEEYASADGAELAFEAFTDPEALAEIARATDVESLDAPDLGDEAVMWAIQSEHWQPPAIPVVTLWVRVDHFIVSIAAVDASEITEPDAAVVEDVMRDQLRRLRRAHRLHQPALAACAPRLIGETTSTLNDDYSLIEGRNLGVHGDTYALLDERNDEAKAQGMLDHHRVRQKIAETNAAVDGGPVYYTAITRRFVDASHAEDFLAGIDTSLVADGRQDLAELDDVPDIGDGARAFTYIGNSGSPSTVLYVLTDDLVFSLSLGPATEPLPDATYDLAEAYLERLDSDDCGEPLPTPRGL